MPPSAAASARELLGPQAAQVVERIPDPELRQKVFEALALCAEGLEVVDALDLSPHETAPSDTRDLSVWNALAPSVRNLLVTVGRVSAALRELFELPAGGDTSNIDGLEAGLQELTTGAPPPPIKDQREGEVDGIVKRTTDQQAAVISVFQLASMLQFDFRAFGERLRNPAVVTDRWVLLGELQELQSKCTQCLEAIVATVVQPFTDRSLEAIWPRYADATARAILLRTTVVDLAHDVHRLFEKAQRTEGETALSVRHALAVRLVEFADHDAYRYLRPADKAALSKFRIALDAFDETISDVTAFRHVVDDLATFLEVMRSINRRDRLLQHDLQALQTVEMLIESEVDDDELLVEVCTVMGRDRDLDAMIRALRRREHVPRDRLTTAVETAFARLKQGL